MVSDCWAIVDIWKHHHLAPSREAASALAVKNGTELECGQEYATLPAAVRQGLIGEAEIDDAVTRLFTARMRLGMFDPPERVRWARIPASVNQAPAHDALALQAAQESLVLLKNDGVLPLSRELKRIAVVGPTADDTMALLGNYFGTPAAPVTILQGIRDAAKGIEVRYARGVDLVEGRDDPSATPLIEPTYLRPSADSPERGLRGEYFRTPDLSGTPALVRTDAQIGFRWDRRFADGQPAGPRRGGAGAGHSQRSFQHPLERPTAAAGIGPLPDRGGRRRRASASTWTANSCWITGPTATACAPTVWTWSCRRAAPMR